MDRRLTRVLPAILPRSCIMFASAQVRRAFTLIELLVVISIIALLLALLLPSLRGARAAARQIQCLPGMRQMGIATLQYAQAHKEQFPLTPGYGAPGVPYWARSLFPYLYNGNTYRGYTYQPFPPHVSVASEFDFSHAKIF